MIVSPRALMAIPSFQGQNCIPDRIMDVQKWPTISRDSMVDSKVLFREIFGNEIFEDYVGQLTLLSSPPPEFDPDLPPEVQKPKLDEIMKAMREERERKLVKTLKNRLEPYVEGRKDEVVNWAKLEAQRLSQVAFGVALLHAIGYIYTRKAAKEIGKRKRYVKVLFLAEWVRDKRHRRNSRTAAASAAVSLIQLREEWERCSQEEDAKDEKTIELAKETREAMLNSFWKMNIADIEMTLSHVCQAVLKDPRASKDILRSRAKAMKKIGTIFRDASWYPNQRTRRKYLKHGSNYGTSMKDFSM